MEPRLEVTVTLTQLRAIVKSLSIGVDQLTQKAMRMGDSPRADLVADEAALLIEAKKEFEEVLAVALRSGIEPF